VIGTPLALAFTAGMFAVVNPCGFAMLPAYLSFFLGDDSDEAPAPSVVRAVTVGVSVSAGFAALFAVVGLIVRHVSDQVLRWTPWLSVVIGVVLVAMGVALLAGWQLKVRVPRLDRGGRTRGVASMAAYGASYAVVSLGCTLPTFLTYVAATLTRTSLASGAAVFLAYASGFATLVTALSVATALTRRSLLVTMRRAIPYIQRGSGALLAVAGAYVSYFGWYELHRLGDPDPVVDLVTGWSADIQAALSSAGATRLGTVLAASVAAAVLAAVVVGRRRGSSPSASAGGL
jgi:cytochrome c-type biogenesis protein